MESFNKRDDESMSPEPWRKARYDELRAEAKKTYRIFVSERYSDVFFVCKNADGEWRQVMEVRGLDRARFYADKLREQEYNTLLNQRIAGNRNEWIKDF